MCLVKIIADVINVMVALPLWKKVTLMQMWYCSRKFHHVHILTSIIKSCVVRREYMKEGFIKRCVWRYIENSVDSR